jgi:hypothetical protein
LRGAHIVEEQRTYARSDMVQVFGTCAMGMGGHDARARTRHEFVGMHCFGGLGNRRFRTLTPLTAPLFADGTRAVVKGDVGGRCREWGERDVFAAGHPQRCGTERTGFGCW